MKLSWDDILGWIALVLVGIAIWILTIGWPIITRP